ncbi:MAG: hypothetical protein AAF721_36330 [Myxococcota bacterium]
MLVLAGCIPPPPPVAPGGPGAPSGARDRDRAPSHIRQDVIFPQPPRDVCDEPELNYGTWDDAVQDAAAREP